MTMPVSLQCIICPFYKVKHPTQSVATIESKIALKVIICGLFYILKLLKKSKKGKHMTSTTETSYLIAKTPKIFSKKNEKKVKTS